MFCRYSSQDRLSNFSPNLIFSAYLNISCRGARLWSWVCFWLENSSDWICFDASGFAYYRGIVWGCFQFISCSDNNLYSASDNISVRSCQQLEDQLKWSPIYMFYAVAPLVCSWFLNLLRGWRMLCQWGSNKWCFSKEEPTLDLFVTRKFLFICMLIDLLKFTCSPMSGVISGSLHS